MSAALDEPLEIPASNVVTPLPNWMGSGVLADQQTDEFSCVPSQDPVCPRFVPPLASVKPLGSVMLVGEPVNEMPFRPTVLKKYPWQAASVHCTVIVTSVRVTVALKTTSPFTVNVNESAFATPPNPVHAIASSAVNINTLFMMFLRDSTHAA
jgi:hypothetical protein